MEPRGSPDYRGKTSYSSPIGSFAGYDKAPPQIALNWKQKRSKPSIVLFLPMTSLLPPFISKANYLEVTAKHVSKEDALVELANHYHLSLEEVLTMGDNFNDLLCSKSRYRGRYGQRSTKR